MIVNINATGMAHQTNTTTTTTQLGCRRFYELSRLLFSRGRTPIGKRQLLQLPGLFLIFRLFITCYFFLVGGLLYVPILPLRVLLFLCAALFHPLFFFFVFFFFLFSG